MQLLAFDNHGHPHTAADTHGNQSGVLALSRLKHVAHNYLVNCNRGKDIIIIIRSFFKVYFDYY